MHYQEQYDNAFWDGQQMVFGDGDGTYFNDFTISVDVIGHELAHGVTQYTAGLTYVTQSGALNESLSDCFGSMVKQQVLGQDAADADWLIGEGLFTENVNGVALRSMKAPGTADDPVVGKDPQPADMDGYVKLPADSQHDNGGVHTNSGIPNRAFYLAATGIGGTSWQGAGLVWYDVVTGSKVTKDIDFAGFAALTVEAAESRFGAGSREAKAVQDAWQTVKVTKAAAKKTTKKATKRPRRSTGPAVRTPGPDDSRSAAGPWQHRPGPSRAVNGRRWVLKRRTTPRDSAVNDRDGGNGRYACRLPTSGTCGARTSAPPSTWVAESVVTSTPSRRARWGRPQPGLGPAREMGHPVMTVDEFMASDEATEGHFQSLLFAHVIAAPRTDDARHSHDVPAVRPAGRFGDVRQSPGAWLRLRRHACGSARFEELNALARDVGLEPSRSWSFPFPARSAKRSSTASSASWRRFPADRLGQSLPQLLPGRAASPSRS